MYMQSIYTTRRVYGSLQLLQIMDQNSGLQGAETQLKFAYTQRNLWVHEILKPKGMLILGEVGYKGSTESSGPLYIIQLCTPSKVGLQ